MMLLLAIALSQRTAECPVFVRANSYPPAVARLTRPYTDCMTQPGMPDAEQIALRRERCSPIRTEQLRLVGQLPPSALRVGSRRVQPEDSFRWVDHVTDSLTGCHTNIYLAGDGAEFPYAED